MREGTGGGQPDILQLGVWIRRGDSNCGAGGSGKAISEDAAERPKAIEIIEELICDVAKVSGKNTYFRREHRGF